MVARGWELVEYDWDPETGLATITYERIRIDTEEVQIKKVVKAQPALPTHTGWYMRRF